MYISCPKCNTRFVVLPDQIGQFGRKVRCSKCSHIWHQRPIITNPNQVKLEPIVSSQVASTQSVPTGPGINLPALLPVKIPFYLLILPAILISLITFFSILLFQDKFWSKDYLSDISIKDVQVHHYKEVGKIVVNYKIVNSSDIGKSIPLIRVRLLDSNHLPLKSHVVDQTSLQLAPKQYVSIKTEFVAAPDVAEEVDVTIGNNLDFILR
jgi:predicted Zn finger-like uncharacterized protein